MTDCWACGDRVDVGATCGYCHAPPWEEDNTDRGVYFIRAECGMVKIGYSGSFWDRIAVLQREGRQTFEVLGFLRGATSDVEYWLHRQFADVRDQRFAIANWLPCHTEWFWPTPALERVVHSEFVDHLKPEHA